jgi:NAD-dependent SIR2 family protein deacetylase
VSDLKSIYISETSVISYDATTAYENNQAILQDPSASTVSTEELALKKMRSAYQKLFSRQYDNFVVLSGAGTSVGIGTGTTKGKTMKGLWDAAVAQIGYPKLELFAKQIGFSAISPNYADLEEMISRANLAETYKPRRQVQYTLKALKALIRSECNLILPDDAPHSIFLRKITARKTKYNRAKIFTLNYDLLFEQAASKGGYVVIDGFSFTIPRTFSGVNFDYDIVIRNNKRAIAEETFAPKVFHLYKPHGSLDWERKVQGANEIFVKSENPSDPIMIYPSSSKYESSYEQPYFEMISRFQQELRERNTMLVIIGFSFYDKHIKAMIMEALDTNPSITVVIAAPDVHQPDSFADMKSKAAKMKNVILINETFENFAKHFPYSDIYDFSEEFQV